MHLVACSAQTANQNTNVAAKVRKVVIKRTSGLIVKDKIQYFDLGDEEMYKYFRNKLSNI